MSPTSSFSLHHLGRLGIGCLALLAAAEVAWAGGPQFVTLAWLRTIALWLTVLVVSLTVLRGIPVFIEARRFFGQARETNT